MSQMQLFVIIASSMIYGCFAYVFLVKNMLDH